MTTVFRESEIETDVNEPSATEILFDEQYEGTNIDPPLISQDPSTIHARANQAGNSLG